MKQSLILFMTILLATPLLAQDTATTAVHKLRNNDEMLPKVSVDLNFKYGPFAEKWDMASIANAYTAYTRSVNVATVSPTFDKDGNAVHIDAHLNYFFGDEHMFGIGIGAMYQHFSGNATMNKFHVEYARLDKFKDTSRQIITANGPITENIKTTSIAIPLMLKFKHQFKKEWGVFAEAGGLFSIAATESYKPVGTTAFDYEAIYQYDPSGKGVYDDYKQDANPDPKDWLITKKHYTSTNHQTDATTVFNNLYTQGYNVKLNSTPQNQSGSHSYNTIGVGLMVQGGISYQLNYRVTANIGAYYMLQTFKNTGNNDWRITDSVGSYRSMVDGIHKNTVQSYGITVGIRYFLGKDRDEDGDGIPDNKDLCPKEYGLALYGGCPDTDGDGVPDKDDRCPTEPGSPCTEGCPDRDGDCVPDKFDHCPDEAADPEKGMLTAGCPDTDGDGVPDEVDQCPDVPGLAKFAGCPDKTFLTRDIPAPDPRTLIPDHIVLSQSIINFKTGKTDIADTTYPALNDVIKKMQADDRLIVFVSGHTDNIGGTQQNMLLSYYRAEAVSDYLVKNGIPANRILISGMGKKEPIIDNTTAENRARNRRIEMRLLLPITK